MKDLFGNDVSVAEVVKDVRHERKSVAAHRLLLQLYGSTAGQKCKGCLHLVKKRYSKAYYKCAVSGLDSCSQNTDWSIRWDACGKFEKDLPIPQK